MADRRRRPLRTRGGADAVTAATEAYEQARRIHARGSVPTAGLADAAAITVREPGRTTDGNVVVVARRANVLIRVEYGGWEGSPDDARAAVIGVVQSTAAAIHLE